MFRHYIVILRAVHRAFWEMLNWGAVDKILWMGVLCLVAWCAFQTSALDMENRNSAKLYRRDSQIIRWNTTKWNSNDFNVPTNISSYLNKKELKLARLADRGDDYYNLNKNCM
jgi:hypothetical protein